MTNTFQSRLEKLNYDVLFKSIFNRPSVYDIGSAQGSWTPVAYKNAKRDILKISLDDVQLQRNSLADNIFRKIGIVSVPESINITPLTLEITESSFAHRNIHDVISMVLNHMVRVFDTINASILKSAAKPGTAITWSTQESFVGDMVRIVSSVDLDEAKKYILLSSSLKSALNFPTATLGKQEIDWIDLLKKKLSFFNCDVIFSPVVKEVYLVIEPLLAEYKGLIPYVSGEGFDERAKEYWIHFTLSNSDFKPRVPEALQSFEVKSLDLTKIFKPAAG